MLSAIHLRLLSLATLATLTPTVTAQTAVFAGNVPPSPWTTTGSPYQVLSTVTIPFPLTIDAGVRVEVLGAYAITAGALTVNGTVPRPVTIRAGGPATAWRGLTLRTASTLRDCHIEDATEAGVRLRAAGRSARW